MVARVAPPLKAAALLASIASPEVKAVEIKGATLYVRSLTGRQRANMVRGMAEAVKEGAGFADYLIVSMSLCEADGTPAFDDMQKAAEALGSLDGDVINALALATLEVSGLSKLSAGAAEKKS